MKGIRIIWKSHDSQSKKGYIRISVRDSELKKTKVISLNLPPISENYFDKKNQLVKKNYKDYEIYNNEIERILNEFSLKKNSNFIKDEKKTLNFFVEEKLIKQTTNQGTKEKYRTTLNLLVLFNKEKYKSPTIFMKSITIDYINEWKNWLRKVRRNSENTISYKIKTFSSFINKSNNNGYYIYSPNPFKSITKKIDPSEIQYLGVDELNRLITTELEEVYRNNEKLGVKKGENYINRNKVKMSLNDVRMWFLFQLFQAGSRVSDILTLKWKHFIFEDNELRYKKRMIKTRDYIETMIFYPSMFILFNYIPQEILSEEEKETIQELKNLNSLYRNNIVNNQNEIKNKKIIVKFRDIDGFNFESFNEINTYLISEKCIEDKLEEIEISIRNKYYLENNIEKEQVNKVKVDIELSELINKDNRKIQLEDLLTKVKSQNRTNEVVVNISLEQNNNELYNMLIKIVLRLKNDKNYSNHFVFPILNNDDFKDIKKDEDFDTMTEIQYLRFTGRRGYYNRLLKQVGLQCNIDNLTSHKSRHSFTSIVLKNNDVNLYDLMKSLGHKQLTTTQVYIQNFKNKRIDDMGKGFSDIFTKTFNPNKLS